MIIEPSPWLNFAVPVAEAAVVRSISTGHVDKAIDQIRNALLGAGWELDTESGLGHGHGQTEFSHFPTVVPPIDPVIEKTPLYYPVREWVTVIVTDPTWPRSEYDGLLAARFVSVRRFCFYDIFREDPQTGDAWVPMGGSEASSRDNLLDALTTAYAAEFAFSFSGNTLVITANFPGPQYNNYTFTGNFGTPGGIAQGGWHLKSPAEMECVVARSTSGQIYWGFFFGELSGGAEAVETGTATGTYGTWYFKLEMPQEGWTDTVAGRRYRALDFTVMATAQQVIYLSGNGNLNDGPPAPSPNTEGNIQGRFFPCGCFIVSRPWVPESVTQPRYVVVAGQFPAGLDWNATTRFYVPGGFPHTTSWYTDALAGPMVLRSVQIPIVAPSGEPVMNHAMLMMAPDRDWQSAIIGKLWNSVVMHDTVLPSNGVSSDFVRWFENAGGSFHLYSNAPGRYYDLPLGSLFFFVPAE